VAKTTWAGAHVSRVNIRLSLTFEIATSSVDQLIGATLAGSTDRPERPVAARADAAPGRTCGRSTSGRTRSADKSALAPTAPAEHQSPGLLGQLPGRDQPVSGQSRAEERHRSSVGATSRRVCQQGSGCHPGLCTFSALPGYPNATAAGNFAADQAGAGFWASPALTARFTRFSAAVDTPDGGHLGRTPEERVREGCSASGAELPRLPALEERGRKGRRGGSRDRRSGCGVQLAKGAQ
jgi:hypothetical protein